MLAGERFHVFTVELTGRYFPEDSCSRVFFLCHTCLRLKRARRPHRDVASTGMQTQVSSVSAAATYAVVLFSEGISLDGKWRSRLPGIKNVFWTTGQLSSSSSSSSSSLLIAVIPDLGRAVQIVTRVSHTRRQAGRLIQRWLGEAEAFLQG